MLALLLMVVVVALAAANSGAAPARDSADPAQGFQYDSAIAFNGAIPLVVWTDARRASTFEFAGSAAGASPLLPPPPPLPPPKRVYGTRLGRLGNVIDPGGIVISKEALSVDDPAVTAGGMRFFVAWSDWRNGRSEIYGSRVTRTGAVLDPPGIPIATAIQGQTPAVAYDGANYLVVWVGVEPGWFDGHIYGARVTAAGVVLDPAGIPISTAKGRHAALAFDGRNYLVVWAARSGQRSDVFAARVSPAGTVLDSSPILISTAAGYVQPTVAFAGANYLVAWEDNRSGDWQIYATRVSPAGGILDPDGIAISTAVNPAVASDGTNFLVVWEDGRSGWRGIHGARVTPGGLVQDPAGIAISTGQLGNASVPALAFDGQNYVVTWSDGRSGGLDVYGARVTRAGRVLDPTGRLLSTAPSVVLCHVPKVVGLALRRARVRIRNANCSIGRVRSRRSKRVRRVVAQSPRAGAERSRGAKVDLVVGRR